MSNNRHSNAAWRARYRFLVVKCGVPAQEAARHRVVGRFMRKCAELGVEPPAELCEKLYPYARKHRALLEAIERGRNEAGRSAGSRLPEAG